MSHRAAETVASVSPPPSPPTPHNDRNDLDSTHRWQVAVVIRCRLCWCSHLFRPVVRRPFCRFQLRKWYINQMSETGMPYMQMHMPVNYWGGDQL